jgi:hypothetical protein
MEHLIGLTKEAFLKILSRSKGFHSSDLLKSSPFLEGKKRNLRVNPLRMGKP